MPKMHWTGVKPLDAFLREFQVQHMLAVAGRNVHSIGQTARRRWIRDVDVSKFRHDVPLHGSQDDVGRMVAGSSDDSRLISYRRDGVSAFPFFDLRR